MVEQIQFLFSHSLLGEAHNFDKYSRQETNSLGFESIMHYGKYSFSKNGEPTIAAICDENKQLGQRSHLSKEDALQLNLLYKCSGICLLFILLPFLAQNCSLKTFRSNNLFQQTALITITMLPPKQQKNTSAPPVAFDTTPPREVPRPGAGGGKKAAGPNN